MFVEGYYEGSQLSKGAGEADGLQLEGASVACDCGAVEGEACFDLPEGHFHFRRQRVLDKLSNSETEPNPYLEDTLSSLYEEIKSTEEELRAVGKQVEQLSKDVGKAYCDYEEAKGRQDEILEAAERKREAEFRAEFPKATFRPMTDVQRDRYFRRTLSEKYLDWKKKEHELNGVEKYLDALRSISSAKKSRKDLLVPTRSFWQEQSEKG